MADDSIVDEEPAKEDHNIIDLDICRWVSRLNLCVRNLDQNMHKLKELKLAFDGFDVCSDLDLGISTNIEGLEQTIDTSIYGNEKSKMGNEGFKKEQDDAKKKKKKKKKKRRREIAQSDSSDHGVSTNTKGLEQEMYRLTNGNEKSEEFVRSEEEEDDVKKSLNEPQNNLDRSYEEKQALKFMKDQALELGTDLSFLLVDLAFLMGDQEVVKVKFQEFKYELGMLKKIVQGEEFQIVNLVQDKIATLLEVVDPERRETAELKKVKNVSLQCYIRRNLLGMKEIPNKESQVDELLNRLFGEIIRLEYILSTFGRPNSPFHKNTLSFFEDGLENVLEKLMEIALKMKELFNNRLEESEKASVGLKLMNGVETEKLKKEEEAKMGLELMTGVGTEDLKKEEDAKIGIKGLKQNWPALVASIAAFAFVFCLGYMKKVERG